ncbi:DNA polymerase III subunit alpha [Bacteroidota bacterium]
MTFELKMYFCHSYYSLKYGTLSIEKLVEEALIKKIKCIALTDINNSTGMMDFVKECKSADIRPVAGIEFRKGGKHVYTGLAKDNSGFLELNTFLSNINLKKEKLPDSPPTMKNSYIIFPYEGNKKRTLKENEFIGVRESEVNRLFCSHIPGNNSRLSNKNRSKLVIFKPVSFSNKKGYFLHTHLRAIDNNILLSQLKPDDLASSEETMNTEKELLKLFENYPDIIRNTKTIFENCSIDFDYKSIKNKKTFTGNLLDDRTLLEKLTLDGLKYRYGINNKEANRRIRKELEVIDKLGFSSYFLITWDIIRYSMSRGFYHVGRGSGANSVVAYCLKITDVDPIELDLYFERFINPKRTSPPDFDIDYSWKERDDVQDYIFKRYGHKHTALLGTISTFLGKSIIRELSKVYGLPKAEIDTLIKDPENHLNQHNISKKIIQVGTMMSGFPNIRSIHAGGILISEEPICAYTALDLPPKGFPTTQWDMYVAEDIGFEKLDILSQRGIGHIKECVDIIQENREIKVDVHQVEKFKKDQYVKQLLRSGETNGCFYVESPAMRSLLKKLRCDNYLSLVAASSIIRPGVSRSGMMREYIYRFHNPKSFEYLHPVMKEQLEETYGVMIYQEDVLKVCHHFAGLDLSDADILRRAMSGKHRSKNEFQKIINKFFSNCKERGYHDIITKEVWRRVESFAGYSFSKAHSASYAVESYQSLFLKAHYPLEFMVAVINNFGGFYKTWVYFNEAKRWGAKIILPCINRSKYKTSIKGKKIFIGFIHIANLEAKLAKIIVSERMLNGDYTSLENFIDRVHTGIEQLIILVRINAFSFTGIANTELLWKAHMLLGTKPKSISTGRLFRMPGKSFKLPTLEVNKTEQAYDEIELLDFPVSFSYFELLKTPFRGDILANKMDKSEGKRLRMVGQLVTIKYVRTVKREWMHFAAFLDKKGEFFDTVHFPDSARNYPFRGEGIYILLGTITKEFDFPSLTVEKMAKLPIHPNPRDS